MSGNAARRPSVGRSRGLFMNTLAMMFSDHWSENFPGLMAAKVKKLFPVVYLFNGAFPLV